MIFRKNKEKKKFFASSNFSKAEHLKFAVDKAMESSIEKAADSVNK